MPLIVEPFLHVGDDRIDNPISGRALDRGDRHFDLVARLARHADAGALDDGLRAELTAQGWLIDSATDVDARFRLRVVTIETHAACNQACCFCPVSIDPRADASMPEPLFVRIIDQLAAFRHTLEAVFLSNYNEPTADPAFVSRCETLFFAGLPIGLNTNGTGLTPARVDALARHGRLRYLSVNLSTLDRGRYIADRGHDHLALVLRNLDYLSAHPVAQEMAIAVLGEGDERHARETAAIASRFADTPFAVQAHRLMDRAGYLDVGIRPPVPHRHLRGCRNVGSRPLEHLHVTASGRCVFCCEDYAEHHTVGDLRTQTVLDVLTGEAIARLRRWSYGLEAAPESFMCRHCVFAISA